MNPRGGVIQRTEDGGVVLFRDGTEAAFIADICANPDDTTPRLIYADWLEEQGDSFAKARADFIRVQCKIASSPEASKWHEIQCDTYERQSPRWLSAPGHIGAVLEASYNLWLDVRASCYLPRPLADAANRYQWWRRGFLEEVTLNSRDWLAYHYVILAQQPVRQVKLLDWPVLESRQLNSATQSSRFRYRLRDYKLGADKAVVAEYATGCSLSLHEERRVGVDMFASLWPNITFLYPRGGGDE